MSNLTNLVANAGPSLTAKALVGMLDDAVKGPEYTPIDAALYARKSDEAFRSIVWDSARRDLVNALVKGIAIAESNQ